jgi:hypothetical protein
MSWSPVQGVLPNVQDLVNWSETESFMEVGQGPNVGCSTKGKKMTLQDNILEIPHKQLLCINLNLFKL